MRSTNGSLRVTSISLLVFIALIATPSTMAADSIRNHEWFVAALALSSAHRYSEGRGVRVALIDTGIDASHPDLAGNILDGIDFTEPNSGRAPHGTIDIDGHGTAMAGLIVGHGLGRADGILGVAPEAKAVPVRSQVGGPVALTESSPQQLAEGIRWATDHQVSVISIAQGAQFGEAELENAVEAAEAADIVLVAAAGNMPGMKTVQYPAAYPGVLAVAATDEHGNHAAISVTGPQVVLSAPGTNIYSDGLNHAYSVGTGTSPATAIVAGAVALVRSRFPKLSAVEVIHRLTATAIDKGAPGRDDVYGFGELNLVAALTAKVPPLNSTTTPTPEATATTPSPTTPAPTAITATKPGSRWLPITGTILVVFALLTVWTIVKRRRT